MAIARARSHLFDFAPFAQASGFSRPIFDDDIGAAAGGLLKIALGAPFSSAGDFLIADGFRFFTVA